MLQGEQESASNGFVGTVFEQIGNYSTVNVMLVWVLWGTYAMAHGWGTAQPRKTLPRFADNSHANWHLVTPTWGGPGYEQGMLHILRQFDTPLFHVALLPGQWAMCNRLGPKNLAVNSTDGTLTYGAPLVLHAYGGAKPHLRELRHLKWFVLGRESLYGSACCPPWGRLDENKQECFAVQGIALVHTTTAPFQAHDIAMGPALAARKEWKVYPAEWFTREDPPAGLLKLQSLCVHAGILRHAGTDISLHGATIMAEGGESSPSHRQRK